MQCTGPPASPPLSPVSQHTFKFKRFGVQFQKQKVSVALSFFLLRIFFLSDKSFIDIEDVEKRCLVRLKKAQLILLHNPEVKKPSECF